jgi:hypothetical protein
MRVLTRSAKAATFVPFRFPIGWGTPYRPEIQICCAHDSSSRSLSLRDPGRPMNRRRNGCRATSVSALQSAGGTIRSSVVEDSRSSLAARVQEETIAERSYAAAR